MNVISLFILILYGTASFAHGGGLDGTGGHFVRAGIRVTPRFILFR